MGGTDPQQFAAAVAAGKGDTLPGNHAPNFAPLIHPTHGAGIEALLMAAGVWLDAKTAES
ncbi:hypothetical protein V5F77_16455 [Xanthobacter sp. DSM 24535]|uniref:hypothetical protein n=1 Tax=Roseixanthobacter psychrophilus TaxID=3119917 RepID=UPI00372B2994